MTCERQTVFVVDDTAEIRIGLTRLLGAAGYLVRSFESAEHFLEEHDNESPGCLILDICMPGLSGLDVQRSLNRLSPARPIIFLTGYADIQTCVHAMKVGAVDFLTKPIDEARLFAAVDHALQLDLAVRNKRTGTRILEQRLEALTPRERQVMEHVIHGRLNKQIAGDLGICEKTVKVHRGCVMSKMKVRSVAELVRLAAGVGDPAEVSQDLAHTLRTSPIPQLPFAAWHSSMWRLSAGGRGA